MNNQNVPNKATEEEKRKVRLHPKYALPSKAASVETQLEMLKGYVIASENGQVPTSLKTVASLLNISPEHLSRCNKFFIDTGMLLKEGKEFRPAPEIVAFNRNLPWDPKKAREALRTLLQDTWFGKLAISKLQLQSEVSEDELVKSFGRESEAPKEMESNLKQLISFLTYAEILERDPETGNLRAGLEAEIEVPPAIPEEKIKPVEERRVTEKPSLLFQINFNITIPTKPSTEELEDIRSLVDTLKAIVQGHGPLSEDK